MKWLMVADFSPRRDSGAAGTLLALGDALMREGDDVRYAWQPGTLPHAGTARDRYLRLARRQYSQVALHLAAEPLDVVSVSQPWAWRIFRDLMPRHPRTLFINRTHGWEARLYAQQTRDGWEASVGLRTRIRTWVGARLAYRACRRAARYAQGVVTASEADARFIRSRYHTSPAHTVAIPYGCEDVGPHADRTGPLSLLFVGNYLPRKGAQVLARVLPSMAATFPEVRLTVVTTADAHPQVHADHQAWGQRLTVHPWLDRTALTDVYLTHDVVLFPSYFEGFGKTWMEGMRAGCCVIGFAEGGLPDVATSGRDALLASPGDADAFAGLLRQALTDPARTRALGAAAHATTQSLTWTRTARATRTWVGQLGAARR